jgi:hypothetical protein
MEPAQPMLPQDLESPVPIPTIAVDGKISIEARHPRRPEALHDRKAGAIL